MTEKLMGITDVKEWTLVDALMVSGVKILEERMLTKFIGNGTLLSGGVKAVAGLGSYQFIKNKFGKILGTAFLIDGAEDLINFIFPASSSTSVKTGVTSQPSASPSIFGTTI